MIAVQRARPDDYEALRPLREAYKAEESVLHPELVDSPGVCERGLKDWLGNDATVVLMAQWGDEVVGYLHLVPGNYIGTNPQGVRSEEYYVAPDYRSTPAAAALWKAAAAIVRENAPVSFQICVLEDNRSVQRLMEKRGFVRVASIYQQEVEDGQGKRRAGKRQEVHRAGAREP